ncbi:MAG TPA: aldehyde oxidoreductase molybdenum-binding subunit PaoC [Steroidobacteraceae bacterium]|nr:aldehyde oxidoreductase molybdenum-binding subunit PaoC [Steroidobacteraceae bacterium]
MKFEAPAGQNPIDRLRIVGKPVDRIDGPLKATGTAPYAYERRDVPPNTAFGYVVGSAIAKGRIRSMMMSEARNAPGVLAIVTAENAGSQHRVDRNTAPLLGGPEIAHYHQAIALVVAETFEQARAAAKLLTVNYAPAGGNFDLVAAMDSAQPRDITGGAGDSRVGAFESAFTNAPVRLDATYTTPDQSHAMMEPHASIAAWQGDELTLWTSSQMVEWCTTDLADTLGIPKEHVRVISPYVGGGFGGKLFLRTDALLATLGARAAGRPVKVTLQRALMMNNTTHRPATIQRLRLAAMRNGKLIAIGHQSWSGDLPHGKADGAVHQTRLLYAAPHRMTATRLALLDLPEGNAMRAPGEATGMMALEIAMDEMAEKLGIDPVEFRIRNDTQVVPDHPGLPATLPFSQRSLVTCLRTGAERFGWAQRKLKPMQVQDGRWLIGMGVAAAYRGNLLDTSGARVRLERDGHVTVETDMTDIGTGSYTIIAQTAAEMLGLPLEKVKVQLGDSRFPASTGSGGQAGANCSTAGVYAACVKLREAIAQKLGFDAATAEFTDGQIHAGGRAADIAKAAEAEPLVAEDEIDYGDTSKKAQQSTFGAHFVEVGVHAATGEIRVRRMLAVCACGRILNPKTARSQVIGAMTMGVGAALMEELFVDKRRGFFVNHDLAGYEIPVHADIPHQDVIFLDEADPMSSPMKAKGVSELGISGVAAAVANAVYNATGIRVRDYPITLDKLIGKLPAAV